MDSIVNYLLQRVATLKGRVQELEAENAALRSQQQDISRVKSNVLKASAQVAQDLLKPLRSQNNFKFGLGSKLCTAIRKGNAEKVQSLLQEDPTLQMRLRAPVLDASMIYGVGGSTALHLAAKYGSLDVCQLLLANGADAWVTDLVGQTALHIAASQHHGAVCELLFEHMGSPRGREAPLDILGITPAGRVALKSSGGTSKERELRTHCTRMLYKVGDRSISPLKAKRSTAQRPPRTPVAAAPAAGPVYGHCSMPGFRVIMEDATALEPELSAAGGRLALFAVFDGHGGDGAAAYCGQNAAAAVVAAAASRPVAGVASSASELGAARRLCLSRSLVIFGPLVSHAIVPPRMRRASPTTKRERDRDA